MKPYLQTTSIAAFAAGLAIFTACNDEITEVTQKTGIDSVEAFTDLPKCGKSEIGSLAYAADSAKVYTCTSDGWVTLNGADGKDGANGKDGRDGKDGTDGKDGSKGKDGQSCTIKKLDSGKGYKVLCDGDSVGVLLNGAKGDKGDKGDNGAPGGKDTTVIETSSTSSCTLDDDGHGTVTITCGTTTSKIYKAQCSGYPYDPDTEYCYDNLFTNLFHNDFALEKSIQCKDSDLWCKNESNDYRAQTGADAGNDDSGIWTISTDNKSYIAWPISIETNENDQFPHSAIDLCHGVCGRAFLLQGKTPRPFIWLSFPVGGTDDNGDTTEIDATDWQGLCVTYTSTKVFELALVTNLADRNNPPMVNTPAKQTPTTKCFEWADFFQSYTDEFEVSGPEAAESLKEIAFLFSADDGTVIDFNIIRLTKYIDR